MVKIITLVLKNGFNYTGEIQSEDEKNIVFLDKFGHKLTIDKGSISVREDVSQ